MQKRGQLSIFLIIGTVLVISVAFLLYNKQVQQQDAILETPSGAVEAAFNACFRGQAEQAIIIQALQGGNIAPEHAVYLPPFTISLATDGTRSLLPTLDEMAADLELNLPAALRTCVDDLADSAELAGITITDADPTINVTFNENGITLRIDYPLQFEQDTTVSTAQPLLITSTRPIAHMRDTAERLLSDDGMMPLGAMLDAPYEVNLLGMFDTFVLYSLVDADSGTTFLFAAPMPQDAFTIEGPSWTTLNPMIIAVDQPFTGKVEAQNGILGITYAVDLPWLTVDPLTGEVTASVDESYAGRHVATFTATDLHGASTPGVVEVTVR